MRIHKQLFNIKHILQDNYFLNFNTLQLDTINYKTKNINCSIVYSIVYKLYSIIIHKNGLTIHDSINIDEKDVYKIIEKYLIYEIRKNKIKHLYKLKI